MLLYTPDDILNPVLECLNNLINKCMQGSNETCEIVQIYILFTSCRFNTKFYLCKTFENIAHGFLVEINFVLSIVMHDFKTVPGANSYDKMISFVST